MSEKAGDPASTADAANSKKSAENATTTASVASGPAAPRRLDHTTACLPIVHGSAAYYLGKKADEFQTHEWTLYLRGPHGKEDLSCVVQKVVFQLHASFAQPLREYTQPPFEVTERGWGEFEAQIRIVWKDPLEKPTVIPHAIKLYPPGTPANVAPSDTETPVISELYDEVVFTNPTEQFYGQLMRLSSTTIPTLYSQQEYFGSFTDTDDAKALLEAQKFLTQELTNVKERLQLLNGELEHVDGELRDLQQEQRNKAAAAAASGSRKKSSSASAAASRGGGAVPASKKTKTSAK